MKKLFSLLFLLLPFLALAQTEEVFVSKEPGKRKAVIEEYTGVRCGNCPDGHRAEAMLLQKYPGQLFAINVHAGTYVVPYPGDPNLSTSDGASLLKTFEIGGFPAAVLNRHKFGSSYNMDEEVKYSRQTEWDNFVQQVFAMDSYVNIAAKGELDWNTRKLSLTVQLYYTGEVPSSTISNNIHVAMTQDGIIAQQNGSRNYNPDQVTEDGSYRHLHVLRDMLTPLEGDVVAPVGKDSLITRTYEWTLPMEVNEIPLDLLNTHFVVYVAESQFEIFDACIPEITYTNAPETVVAIDNVQGIPSYACELAGRASFTLTNRLGKDISEVTFSIQTSWGTTEYTYKAGSVLKAGESVQVSTDPFAARPNGEETAEIKVKAVNGEAYEADATSTGSAEISALYAFTHSEAVTLNVVQDRYGSEITWNFKDMGNDAVLYSGGPYRDLSSVGTRTNSTEMHLEKGCYAFTIHDASGDGINSKFGNGNINFVAEGQEFYRHDGKFADSLVIMFDTRETAANGKTEIAGSLMLRPNPANDIAELSFTTEKAATVHVRILDRSGACMLDLGNRRVEGETRMELPLQKLVPGMYFVSLRGEGINLTSKLVVVR